MSFTSSDHILREKHYRSTFSFFFKSKPMSGPCKCQDSCCCQIAQAPAFGANTYGSQLGLVNYFPQNGHQDPAFLSNRLPSWRTLVKPQTSLPVPFQSHRGGKKKIQSVRLPVCIVPTECNFFCFLYHFICICVCVCTSHPPPAMYLVAGHTVQNRHFTMSQCNLLLASALGILSANILLAWDYLHCSCF